MDIARQAEADFAGHFGGHPQVVVRSPGRVNLVGEHTDYSLLPVLPLAIQRGTWLAARATDDGVVRAVSAGFAGQASLDRDRVTEAQEGWQSYLAGALRELPEWPARAGAEIAVHGNLPMTGGLSSSSSLTVGLLSTFNYLWGLNLDKRALVERAIVAERHVGVESGGMDQTVIALAHEGTALRIDFNPPAARTVPLPEDLRLLVAYSGSEAPKGGAVKDAYNTRVVGCRCAASLLARAMDKEVGTPPLLGHLGDVPLELVEALPRRTTAAETAKQCQRPAAELVRLTAGSFDPTVALETRAYARHVLDEARRVEQAENALKNNNLKTFGALLDASHRSLAHDFRCSTDALDDLCQALRDAGALGARLTGAGFGGYAIAAHDDGSLGALLNAARQGGGPCFAVQPTRGASMVV